MAKTIHSKRHTEFCALLRQARKDAGLTQEELARKLGKYKTYISKIEAGERRLDVLEFAELVEALQCDASKLFKEILSVPAE